MNTVLDKQKRFIIKKLNIGKIDIDNNQNLYVSNNEESIGMIIYKLNMLITIELYTYKGLVTSLNTIVNDEKNFLYIKNIETYKKSCGYGTLAMHELIKYAKNNNYLYITGGINNLDKDNFNLLNNFFKKLGFSVTLNKSKTKGRICLYLK